MAIQFSQHHDEVPVFLATPGNVTSPSITVCNIILFYLASSTSCNLNDNIFLFVLHAKYRPMRMLAYLVSPGLNTQSGIITEHWTGAQYKVLPSSLNLPSSSPSPLPYFSPPCLPPLLFSPLLYDGSFCCLG